MDRLLRPDRYARRIVISRRNCEAKKRRWHRDGGITELLKKKAASIWPGEPEDDLIDGRWI